MDEKDNMFVKEILYNPDHSENDYNHSVENDFERSVCHNILNESLRSSENEIYIESLERIFTLIAFTSTTIKKSLVIIFVGGSFKMLIENGRCLKKGKKLNCFGRPCVRVSSSLYVYGTRVFIIPALLYKSFNN